MDSIEKDLWDAGRIRVAGVDEAGRGALAGPVVAAAVIFRKGTENFGLRDSKKLTPSRRDILFEEIYKTALAVGVGVVEPEEIDRINILNATMKAMQIAVNSLKESPDYILVDGNRTFKSLIPIKAIVKGDDKSMTIAAASIIAKVTRDRIMCNLAEIHADYEFQINKGYGTEEHRRAIRARGQSAVHRKSFVLKGEGTGQISMF